jgi:hypothetical protein
MQWCSQRRLGSHPRPSAERFFAEQLGAAVSFSSVGGTSITLTLWTRPGSAPRARISR